MRTFIAVLTLLLSALLARAEIITVVIRRAAATTTSTSTSTSTTTTTTTTSTTGTASTTTSTSTTSTTTSTSTTSTTLSTITCSIVDHGEDPFGDSVVPSNGVTLAANKLRLVFAMGRHTGGASASPTVSGVCGPGWDVLSPAGTCCSGESPDTRRLAVYRCLEATPRTGNVVMTWAAAQDQAYWAIVECDNVDTSGTNGAGAIAQWSGQGSSASGGATWSLGSVPASNSAMIAAWVVDGVTIGPESGWTELSEDLDTSTLEVEWINSGDQSVSATWSGSHGYVSLGGEIKHQ